MAHFNSGCFLFSSLPVTVRDASPSPWKGVSEDTWQNIFGSEVCAYRVWAPQLPEPASQWAQGEEFTNASALQSLCLYPLLHACLLFGLTYLLLHCSVPKVLWEWQWYTLCKKQAHIYDEERWTFGFSGVIIISFSPWLHRTCPRSN